MNSHVRESPPAQFLETSDLQPRQNGHGSDLAGRSRNSEPQPPSGPGGRRRTGDSRKQPRPEPMDVDSPAPSHPPRMQESRSASNAVPDRGDTKGDLPRGPKAMTSKPPPAPPTSLPPKPTTLSERYPGRSPPPHLVTPDERSSQRTDERPIIDSHSERHRDLPREHRDPGIPQPRRRSPESVRASWFVTHRSQLTSSEAATSHRTCTDAQTFWYKQRPDCSFPLSTVDNSDS